MPKEILSIEIGASAEAVFDLIHDYDRRLEWDTLLRKALILDGWNKAGKGVRTLCVGTWKSGGIGVETEYISFERGRVAAVKLCNRPLFFDSFAATIQHKNLEKERSMVSYIYSFRARPRMFRWILEPLMNLFFYRETKNRLRALKRFMEREQ